MNDNKGLWVGGAVLVIAVLLGLWWFSAYQAPGNGGNNVNDEQSTGTNGEQGSTGGGGIVSLERRTSSSVADIVASLGGTAAFSTLFSSTGVKSTIQGVGPYTIFVPTDGAFSLLPSGTIANMTAAQKKRLVQYHIISGKAIDPDAIKSGQVQALSKDMLNFEVSSTDRTARVNSAFIIKAYQGRNGMVYLISAVLVPPQPSLAP